mmetsp:Transcript_11526/g.15871  ORF Transcript_11526/g.15871 Transcript_11526/m.15871 type:complete len:158 (+) Transcript_11526:41-514(+)
MVFNTQRCSKVYLKVIVDGFQVIWEIKVFMRHNTNGESLWASKAMEMIATNIKNNNEATISIELKAMLVNCGMGTLFENLTHKKLSRPGFVGSAMPLYHKNAINTDNEAKEVTLGFPVMVILNTSDIHLLPEKYYGLPAVHDFPLIDAVVQPTYFSK